MVYIPGQGEKGDESSRMMYVRHHNFRYAIYVRHQVCIRHKSSALCNVLRHRAELTFGAEHIVPKFNGAEVRIPLINLETQINLETPFLTYKHHFSHRNMTFNFETFQC